MDKLEGQLASVITMMQDWGDYMREVKKANEDKKISFASLDGRASGLGSSYYGDMSSVHGRPYPVTSKDDLLKEVKEILKGSDCNLKAQIPNASGKETEASTTKKQEGFYKVIQRSLRAILLLQGGNHYAAAVNWLLGVTDVLVHADDKNTSSISMKEHEGIFEFLDEKLAELVKSSAESGHESSNPPAGTATVAQQLQVFTEFLSEEHVLADIDRRLFVIFSQQIDGKLYETQLENAKASFGRLVRCLAATLGYDRSRARQQHVAAVINFYDDARKTSKSLQTVGQLTILIQELEAMIATVKKHDISILDCLCMILLKVLPDAHSPGNGVLGSAIGHHKHELVQRVNAGKLDEGGLICMLREFRDKVQETVSNGFIDSGDKLSAHNSMGDGTSNADKCKHGAHCKNLQQSLKDLHDKGKSPKLHSNPPAGKQWYAPKQMKCGGHSGADVSKAWQTIRKSHPLLGRPKSDRKEPVGGQPSSSDSVQPSPSASNPAGGAPQQAHEWMLQFALSRARNKEQQLFEIVSDVKPSAASADNSSGVTAIPASCSADSVGGGAVQYSNAEALKAAWEAAKEIEGAKEFVESAADAIEKVANSVEDGLLGARNMRISMASTPWIDKALEGRLITAADVKRECKKMTKEERAVINNFNSTSGKPFHVALNEHIASLRKEAQDKGQLVEKIVTKWLETLVAATVIDKGVRVVLDSGGCLHIGPMSMVKAARQLMDNITLVGFAGQQKTSDGVSHAKLQCDAEGGARHTMEVVIHRVPGCNKILLSLGLLIKQHYGFYLDLIAKERPGLIMVTPPDANGKRCKVKLVLSDHNILELPHASTMPVSFMDVTAEDVLNAAINDRDPGSLLSVGVSNLFQPLSQEDLDDELPDCGPCDQECVTAASVSCGDAALILPGTSLHDNLQSEVLIGSIQVPIVDSSVNTPTGVDGSAPTDVGTLPANRQLHPVCSAATDTCPTSDVLHKVFHRGNQNNPTQMRNILRNLRPFNITTNDGNVKCSHDVSSDEIRPSKPCDVCLQAKMTSRPLIRNKRRRDGSVVSSKCGGRSAPTVKSADGKTADIPSDDMVMPASASDGSFPEQRPARVLSHKEKLFGEYGLPQPDLSTSFQHPEPHWTDSA